jgi:hypothetical protein
MIVRRRSIVIKKENTQDTAMMKNRVKIFLLTSYLCIDEYAVPLLNQEYADD